LGGLTLLAGLQVAGSTHTADHKDLFDPHGDPDTGVWRIATQPPTRGECIQCHETHAPAGSAPPTRQGLFAPNDNGLCYCPGSASPCHQATPPGYPADEADRIPEGLPGAGYFEVNAGGRRVPGVLHRERWPGAIVFEDDRILGDGRYVSPHRSDANMPRRDPGGRGMCLNCHDVHGSENAFDILVDTYSSIAGWTDPGPPAAYALCFRCHGRRGPAGMRQENRWIEDYYDEALQGSGTAGHQIRLSAKSALSWPSTVRKGDRLPCYDCHNPHGSRGNDGSHPNAFLISDQRDSWSDLTATASDPLQNRRFCLGCHIPSDGMPGSVTVEGIVMNAIPAGVPEHATASWEGCFRCHGGDYSSATAHNVHHPRIP
jgi:hypothetical protein